MTEAKSYDAKLIVTSHWHGTVTAPNATEADERAREAFDKGELTRRTQDITYVDIRPALKKYMVTYAVQLGFVVPVEAATAEDAEAIVDQQLSDEQCILPNSNRGHFEGNVIEAEEVTP